MIEVSAVALLLVSGCVSFRRGSELEQLFADLEALLDDSGAAKDELLEIAGRVRVQSRSLQELHREFADGFNRQAIDRKVPDEELLQVVTDYEASRRELRDQLLNTQDELHVSVSSDMWPDVLDILQRKGRAIVPRAGASG